MIATASMLVLLQWTTFYAAFEEGLAAQKRGEHGAAMRAFQSAAALKPEPKAQVKTYGTNFMPNYYPYLRWAECALALGDLDQAEKALAQSARG